MFLKYKSISFKPNYLNFKIRGSPEQIMGFKMLITQTNESKTENWVRGIY